ncbi:response regulator [Desulfobacter sp.]|uniref:response regulator n=1 Tax=Desulfobacter sp. TaxID=2294 RepID=UPI0025795D5B|nr:response regulator [Desulfobacter sp.]
MRSAIFIRNLKISHYLIILFFILSFVINGAITFILYQTASKQAMLDIKRRLHDIVSISSRHIDGDMHHRLLPLARQTAPISAQNSDTYQQLKQVLQKIRDASTDIHFIYTMQKAEALSDEEQASPKDGSPKIMFMVDAETDPGQMAKLGDIYADASPLLTSNFVDMERPVIEEAIYQDHWGTWLSGYAPFYDSQGRRAGVLGVDISATSVTQYQNRILLKSLMIFLMILPFVIAAALFMGRWIGIPMGMMQQGAQAIASGNLDHRLKISMGRELSVLAKSMNFMAESLQQEQLNLQRMISKYRNIFENATEGIFQSNSKGRLITANRAMVEMLGYSSLDEMQEAIAYHIANIYENSEDRQKVIHHLEAQGTLTGFEVRLKRKDGSGIMAELNVHLCKYETQDGSETIIEGSIRDITQRIEREKAVREKEAALASSQAKSEFLANMSHEIRTPLNAVMGMTDLMGRTRLSDAQQQYLKKITISSKSLLAVINDILDFSKIEAGRLELEHAPFSLYDLMANISEMFALKADEKGVEFLLSIDEHAPTAVIGDSVRLGQVLINLVGNAIKFTERGEIVVNVAFSMETKNGDDSFKGLEGRKKVEKIGQSKKSEDAKKRIGQFTFSVQDTGIGIPEDRLVALFESFTQADGSTTRKYGGTGLGLSISRRLVNLMGGDIIVTSAPGTGSRFSFTIPMERQPEKNQIFLTPPRDLRGLKVLIVDDNRTSLDILAGVIQSFQMEAMTASSGEDALDVLMRHTAASPFDLVLMDWKMPGMNGLEAARKIKLEMALDKTPIVCMVSAHAREDLIQQADRKFLDAFIHKPVNQSFLFDTIMELFGRHDALVSKSSDMPFQSLENRADEKLKGKRVLLVEDNEINREVALEWLASAGINVEMAVNGKNALVFLGCTSDGMHYSEPVRALPDAVLMDIQMPEMDGFEATVHIRKDSRFQDLPIIAMTAHALKGDRERCLEVGMNDYITKPIDPILLFETLAKWITPSPHGVGEALPEQSETGLESYQATGLKGYSEIDSGEHSPGLGTKSVPAQKAADAPPPFEIPGIDVPKALYRANHNHKLYKKLIKSFVRDFSGAQEEIRSHLATHLTIDKANDVNKMDDANTGAIENAHMIAHSIKGVSANIGAETLSGAAADLEQAILSLRESGEEKIIHEEIWQHFTLELNKVVSGIRDHLSAVEDAVTDTISHKNPSSTDLTRGNGRKRDADTQRDGKDDEKEVEFNDRSVQNIAAVLETLDRLDAMLDDDLEAARDMLEAVEIDLKAVVGPVLFANLMDAMDDFEIDEASEIIQQISQTIKQCD